MKVTNTYRNTVTHGTIDGKPYRVVEDHMDGHHSLWVMEDRGTGRDWYETDGGGVSETISTILRAYADDGCVLDDAE